jgi:hypothetical protein
MFAIQADAMFPDDEKSEIAGLVVAAASDQAASYWAIIGRGDIPSPVVDKSPGWHPVDRVAPS